MLKKTITYNGYDENGNEIPFTDDFYFNMTKAELAELKIVYKGIEGGFEVYVRQIQEARDLAGVLESFKDIIRMSVGRRSEDGKRFIKNATIAAEFMESNAFSDLFLSLVADDNAAVNVAEFMKGILPSDFRVKVDEVLARKTTVEETSSVEPELPRKSLYTDFTREELLDMPTARFNELFGTNAHAWPKPLLEIAFARKTH